MSCRPIASDCCVCCCHGRALRPSCPITRTHLHGLYPRVQQRLGFANVRRRHGAERLLQGGLLGPLHPKRHQGRGSQVTVLGGRVHGEVVDPAWYYLKTGKADEEATQSGGAGWGEGGVVEVGIEIWLIRLSISSQDWKSGTRRNAARRGRRGHRSREGACLLTDKVM